MNLVIRAVSILAIVSAISCSSGGGSDSNNPDMAKQQAAKSLVGKWKSGGLEINISDSRMQISGQCEGGGPFQLDVAIKLSATDITIQEDKAAPCVTLKTGEVLSYKIDGDKMDLTLADKKTTYEFKREGAAPAPNNGNNGTNGGNGNNAGVMSFNLYGEPNCQGIPFTLTLDMDCSQLSGTVHSMKQAGQQCQTQNPQNADVVCQDVKNTVNGAGRRQ